MPKITNTRQTAAIKICERTATEKVKSLILEIKRPAGKIKPRSPTITATCIRCFRKPSFALAAAPILVMIDIVSHLRKGSGENAASDVAVP